MIRTMSPVEQYTFIHNFSPKRNRKTIQKVFHRNSKKKNHKDHFIKLFSADAKVFFAKTKIFLPLKACKNTLKSCS